MSTTMVLVRILVAIARNKEIGPRLVPIVPDEARTFGMEGMFRQVGIYAPEGQKYEPMDAADIMPYRESAKGQMLQEGINEDGAMSSWIAAATSYANNGVMTIPVYIFYSMFGFQRIGDLAWAAGDMLARGFLIGGTSGRTTLNGEGLQHQDGHSQLFAGFIPNCISYDPTFGYELAVIFHDGLKRMYERGENVYYYITTLNENYSHPGLPEGCRGRHHQGDVPLSGQRRVMAQDPGAADGLRRHPQRGDRGGGPARRRTGTLMPISGRPRASTSWRVTVPMSSAGTCCTRISRHARAGWRSASMAPRGR